MAADPQTRQAVNEIFDDSVFDLDEDVFADRPVTLLQDTRDDKPTLSPRSALKRKSDGLDGKENFEGLGLDEEVKIAKKRKPIAKLDEARLLSEPGIPKIRSLIRSKQMSKKLRLKGKGHEFTDAARLLNYYQLWLDNLYPRAKFADALQLVEKAGHTKRMHMMRYEWINEGKPGYMKPVAKDFDLEVSPDEMPDLFAASTANASKDASRPDDDVPDTNDDLLFIPDGEHTRHADGEDHDEPVDDELDALLAMQNHYFDAGSKSTNQRSDARGEEESEGEDDLDALLAEQDAQRNTAANISRTQNPESQQNRQVKNHVDHDDNDDDDDDDLDALLAEQETKSMPQNPHVVGSSTEETSKEQRTLTHNTESRKPDTEEEEDNELTNAIRDSPSRYPNAQTQTNREQPIEEEEEEEKEKEAESQFRDLMQNRDLSISPEPNE